MERISSYDVYIAVDYRNNRITRASFNLDDFQPQYVQPEHYVPVEQYRGLERQYNQLLNSLRGIVKEQIGAVVDYKSEHIKHALTLIGDY